MPFLKDIKNPAATDQELVQLYKQDRDIRVLAELYQRYMDLLFAVCLKYLKDPEAAKDAVMAIFEELVTKLLKHEISHFKGWLYMVAKNFCLMQLRTQKQMPMVQDPEFMQLTENLHLNGVFEKEEHLSQLTKCMDLLSPDQKQSVELFYMQERSYKEIAGITHTEWGKVRSLIQNARRNLKNCMDKNITPD
jgi:RNA polymerase sigma factor (sigma-70 family)